MTDLVRAALLDDRRIYLRIDELPANELTDLHLPHITECDLPPDQYQWNEAESRFEPLRYKPDPIEPDALNGIAAALAALFRNTKTPMPPQTAEWLRSHLKSFDFTGEF